MAPTVVPSKKPAAESNWSCGGEKRAHSLVATFRMPRVSSPLSSGTHDRPSIPGGGLTVRLKRQIPYTKAMEMILTGEPLSAAEA